MTAAAIASALSLIPGQVCGANELSFDAAAQRIQDLIPANGQLGSSLCADLLESGESGKARESAASRDLPDIQANAARELSEEFKRLDARLREALEDYSVRIGLRWVTNEAGEREWTAQWTDGTVGTVAWRILKRRVEGIFLFQKSSLDFQGITRFVSEAPELARVLFYLRLDENFGRAFPEDIEGFGPWSQDESERLYRRNAVGPDNHGGGWAVRLESSLGLAAPSTTGMRWRLPAADYDQSLALLSPIVEASNKFPQNRIRFDDGYPYNPFAGALVALLDRLLNMPFMSSDGGGRWRFYWAALRPLGGEPRVQLAKRLQALEDLLKRAEAEG